MVLTFGLFKIVFYLVTKFVLIIKNPSHNKNFLNETYIILLLG